MSEIQVEAAVSELGAFQAWQSSMAEQQDLYNKTPNRVDPLNRTHLNGQLRFLDAVDAQHDARRELMVELAEQGDDFLPLAYRIGTLAALLATNTMPEMKYLGKGHTITRRDTRPTLMSLVQGEQGVFPSADPLTRGQQIGQELTRIGALLDSDSSIKVGMVWSGKVLRGDGHNEPDSVVVGTIAKPREAFKLTAPSVKQQDGKKIASFNVPEAINGISAHKLVTADKLIPAKINTPSRVTAPILVKLGANARCVGSVDALYIGESEVSARVVRSVQQRRAMDAARARRRANAYSLGRAVRPRGR